MKKLFKNLMLVAVAAMAFVACSQEGNEVNILTKETTFEFTAGFNEDTRSGFGEKEGDAYPSVWYGGESIIAIFSNEDGVIGTAYSSIDDLGEGVESSKTATFTVKYEGSLPDNYSVTFYSGSWNTNYKTGEAYYYISDNQRCTDTSVESSNHLCKTEAIEVVNGEISTLNLTFNTATAFGKVTMEQFSEVADKISEVKVTINGDTTYTVTPNALTKPVVWFACEAIESVTSLVVEAKVDGVTYIKTKEDIAEGALSFNTGRVRPINVKDMTEKPADYNLVLTKVKSVYNNSFSFVGDNENDRLVIDFNPNLTIVAGTYKYSEYFTGAPEYNRAQFNISSAYSENYDYWCYDDIVITDKGEGIYDIAIYTTAYISGSTKSVKITYTGKLEAEKVDLTVVSAAATQGTKGGDNNYYTVSFTLSNNDVIALEMRTDGKNYLTVGTYTNDWSSYNGGIYPGYINYVYYNKSGADFNSCKVAYDETTLYTVKFGVNGAEYTYTGAIEGLDAPSAGGGDEPGTGEGGDTPDVEATELTITSHFTVYSDDAEHELGFYYDEANAKYVDIDFLSNPIVAGTYTLTDGLSGMYCKSHGGDITDITVIVTDNGDGTLTFDATFKAGDGNWYHFIYTAQIYA